MIDYYSDPKPTERKQVMEMQRRKTGNRLARKQNLSPENVGK